MSKDKIDCLRVFYKLESNSCHGTEAATLLDSFLPDWLRIFCLFRQFLYYFHYFRAYFQSSENVWILYPRLRAKYISVANNHMIWRNNQHLL